MKKLFLMIALCGATYALANAAKPPKPPKPADPFADCAKLLEKLANGKLKPAKQTALLALIVSLRTKRVELERRLALGLLSDNDQRELNQHLTYTFNI